MKRIHIVGTGPRTGTTLLAEMMISCFNIDLSTGHEDSIYVVPVRNADVYLTKAPRDIMVVKPLLRILPELYVICMLRDPRDMIVSKHRNAPDKYWAGLTFWKTYSPFCRKLSSHPRVLVIKYEDLVTRPEEIQNRLIGMMPFLSRRADFSSFDRLASPSTESLDAMGGLRAASSSSIGNWHQHLPRVAGQLKLHGSIAADLIAYGYESDTAWEEELTGVEPDTSPGYWPEHLSSRLLRRRLWTSYPAALWVLLGHYPPTSFLLRLIQAVYRQVRSTWKRLKRGLTGRVPAGSGLE
jgi:hypothetical protein